MKLSGNKILITGGASGIGLGLTERFLKEGNTLIICGRRAELLDSVSKRLPGIIYKVCDLSREKERTALFDWIKQEHSDVNVLVNNAGIQNWMKYNDPDFYERARVELNTNVLAPLHLISLFVQLPALKTLINVSSGLAFVSYSKVPVYCATKAFLRSFTLSLRHMLRDSGIEVIEMIPPALNTDLGGKGLHEGQPAVSDFVEAIFEQLKEGKSELTFGFSEMMSKATPEQIREVYARMNP